MRLTHIQQLHGYVIQTFFSSDVFYCEWTSNYYLFMSLLTKRLDGPPGENCDVRVLLCNMISRLWLTGSVALH